MINILSSLFLFELLLFTYAQIPIWNFEKSSIDLLSENPNFYKYTIFSSDTDKIYLTKELNKTTENIDQQNYITLNDKSFTTRWENILDYYNLENKLYFCPSGNNYLSYYSDNEIKEMIHSDNNITQEWDLICYYQKNKNIIYISYLNSDDINIYGYMIDSNDWFSFKMDKGFLDIIWPKNIENEIYHIFGVLTVNNGIRLAKMEVTIRESKTINMIDSQDIDIKLNETFAFFNDEGYFYWITYNNTYFYSGYSINPLDDFSKLPKDIKFVKNSHSPFEFIENIQINYIRFIRNTKYAFYEIKGNDKIYHGVIDITLNKIILNTDELIKDFKPYSKNSLLFITDKSAYKICVFALSDGQCINECPDNQSLILDPTNNNYCGVEKQCDNYILKPIDICVDECDSTYYIVQNEKICGLCKNLNSSYPYKIINESYCRKERPDNTYIYNEQYYILNYCHSSCATCSGEKDNECLSCNNGSLIDGKCYYDDCPNGYYKSTNGTCVKCNPNCLTCNGESENGNNHCLSCNESLNESILVIADGFGNNCVDKCPEKTKLDKDNKKCINENKEEKSGNEEKESDGKGYIKWIIIAIVILILLILLIVAFILIRKYRNRKNGEKLIEGIKEMQESELQKKE